MSFCGESLQACGAGLMIQSCCLMGEESRIAHAVNTACSMSYRFPLSGEIKNFLRLHYLNYSYSQVTLDIITFATQTAQVTGYNWTPCEQKPNKLKMKNWQQVYLNILSLYHKSITQGRKFTLSYICVQYPVFFSFLYLFIIF